MTQKTKKISVNVTSGDIELGLRYNPKCCPVARAINRRIEHDVSITTYIFNNHFWECVELPPPAKFFTKVFDRGYDASPFEFILVVPMRW